MCTYTTHSVYMYGVTLVGTYVIFLIFHVSPCLWVFGNMLVYVIWEYGTERLYVCVCVLYCSVIWCVVCGVIWCVVV